MVLLSNEDLGIETNLNAKPEEIEYKIMSDPTYGVLKVLKRKFTMNSMSKLSNSTTATNFTLLDVNNEKLAYWNTEVASMDRIKYERK